MNLETATVAELARLLDLGEITSADLTQAHLDRVATLDPVLSAVRAVNPNALAEARAAADGPLRGIPVLVKDNIDVEGMPTTAGSVAMAHAYPAGDAALVTNLRAAGAVILGKANLTEWANFLAEGMPGGYSSLGGQVVNPYDAALSPRGSSAGSAVAVAAGLATLAVGTETSGSILAPAMANSVVGVKPTVGLVSRAGVVPIAESQDTPGPLTRTVADAAALLTAMGGVDVTTALHPDSLRGAKIGVVRDERDDPLWHAARAALTDQGATLVPVDLDLTESDSTVLNYEFKRDLDTYLANLPPGPAIRSLADLLAYNEAHPAAMLKYGQERALVSQAMDLSPSSADTARYQADRARDLAESKDRIDAAMTEADLTALLFPGIEGCSVAARAGYPSITVPAGYHAVSRHPFAITLVGKAWTEATLLGYAYAYEQATRLHRPPSEINPSLFNACRTASSGP